MRPRLAGFSRTVYTKSHSFDFVQPSRRSNSLAAKLMSLTWTPPPPNLPSSREGDTCLWAIDLRQKWDWDMVRHRISNVAGAGPPPSYAVALIA
jgi:hypothetical protein